MNKKDFSIVVTGDICINYLQWKGPPLDIKGLNWQYHYNFNNISIGGESLLLADMVRKATGREVLSPKIDKKTCDINELILSAAELDCFPKFRNSKVKVYRVSRFLGFSGPLATETKLLKVERDIPDPDIVIIDDENNGFNMNYNYWPLGILETNHHPIIIYKMNRPRGKSNLWNHIKKNHLENTIIIINSEDMRSRGVNISKSLSWEKTAQEFVWQLENNPGLNFLRECQHLVVPFGLEGCIYYRKSEKPSYHLFFLPSLFEGEFAKVIQGNMYGLTSCFAAALSRRLLSGLKNHQFLSSAVKEGIKEGIVAAQNYFIEGFGVDPSHLKFPDQEVFNEKHREIIIKEHVQEVSIPSQHNGNSTTWYILNDKSSNNLAEIAYHVVKDGEEKALRTIPMAKFGRLKTVDRMEIEGYRSINNLISEYIKNSNAVRPLSIAVFGTPGSGKSFGVTEVASSIAPHKIVKLSLNLSQLISEDEITKFFHYARDFSLQGKLPLIIFDEFDSERNGKLGWLKTFLAPMQDGMFRDGDSIHPIGKAIFVFAGGTSSTFNEFIGQDLTGEEKLNFDREFRESKGIDFISRLRGYVNILGPNPNHENDQLFIIRRAMILRFLIEKKAPHLINNGEAQIDNGVLRAMLKVSRFKHETRSMEAILEMSMLSLAKKWEQSHLPSKEQLLLHVDEEQFMRYLMQDAFYSEKVESLAAHLYKIFNSIINNKNVGWLNLNNHEKKFYLDLAKQIPDGMLLINYDIVSVNETPKPVIFTKEELEILAKYEHTRWLLHKKNRGWNYGTVKDSRNKLDPQLISYDLLKNEQKELIQEFVSHWSKALSKINFKLEKLIKT